MHPARPNPAAGSTLVGGKRDDRARRAREAYVSRVVGLLSQPFACQAPLLLAQNFELQGENEAARREHRALRRSERRVVAEVLGDRESLVAFQPGARQSERHLQLTLVASKPFERWSLADAPMRIGNRRHFERSLAERLPPAIVAGRPLTVAMVDAGKFKSVNEPYARAPGR